MITYLYLMWSEKDADCRQDAECRLLANARRNRDRVFRQNPARESGLRPLPRNVLRGRLPGPKAIRSFHPNGRDDRQVSCRDRGEKMLPDQSRQDVSVTPPSESPPHRSGAAHAHPRPRNSSLAAGTRRELPSQPWQEGRFSLGLQPSSWRSSLGFVFYVQALRLFLQSVDATPVSILDRQS